MEAFRFAAADFRTATAAPSRTERKMAKMCALETFSGTAYVNPTSVRMLKVGVHPNETLIEFDTHHLLVIKAPLEEVRKAIDTALNTDHA